MLGVATSAAFTRARLAREDVRRGEQDTGLLERAQGEVDLAPPDDPLPVAALAAFAADTAGLTVPPGSWRRRRDALATALAACGGAPLPPVAYGVFRM